MRIFGPKPIKHATPYWAHPDTPMLQLGSVTLRARHLYEGTFITGGVGSGKTSSSGKALLRATIRAGWGAFMAAVKENEGERLAEEVGREGRDATLITVDESCLHRINTLNYELATNAPRGFEHNLVSLIMQMAEDDNVANNASGGENPFFQKSAAELLFHSIAIIIAAYGQIDLVSIHRFISTAPTTRAEADDPRWQKESFFSHTMLLAAHKARHEGDAYAQKALEEHGDYWFDVYPKLGDRTRTSVNATLTSVIHPLLAGVPRTLLNGQTNFVPELCREGAIIILDIPLHKFGRAALMIQRMLISQFYTAMQRTPITKTTRPCSLYMDEYQALASPTDIQALATARAARVAPIFISQDIPTLRSAFASVDEHAADGLLAKAQNKFFHATTDVETARYASALCGKIERHNHSRSLTKSNVVNNGSTQGEDEGSYGGGHGRSLGETESISTYQDDAVPPETLANELRTGGPKNNYRCDAIVVRSNARFKSTGRNYAKVEFSQK